MLFHGLRGSGVSGFGAGQFSGTKAHQLRQVPCFKICPWQWNDDGLLGKSIVTP